MRERSWQPDTLRLLLFGLSCVLLLSGCNSVAWLMSAPVVEPQMLAEQLGNPNPPVIFDLRDAPDFAAGHIPSAQRVAFGGVGTAARQLPQERSVVLVCYRGNLAALAAPAVRGVGHERVAVLGGGMQAWVAQGRAIDSTVHERRELPTATLLQTTWFSCVVAYAAGVVIKPIYMLLTLGLCLWLRHTRLRELARLRTGLAVFLVGEAACLFNFYLSDPLAPIQWLECVHELGMVVGSAYGFWGVYGIIDNKLLAMNDLERGCALGRLCGTCSRQPELLCMPQRQLRHLLLLTLPLALFPWTLELLVRDSAIILFGTTVEYRWPILNQWIELRAFPAIAVFALLVAWVMLRGPRRYLGSGQRALFLSLGLLSFSDLRGLLDAAFTRRPYWADIWEEVTELLALAAVALLLWIFRRRLELVSSSA